MKIVKKAKQCLRCYKPIRWAPRLCAICYVPPEPLRASRQVTSARDMPTDAYPFALLVKEEKARRKRR